MYTTYTTGIIDLIDDVDKLGMMSLPSSQYSKRQVIFENQYEVI